MKNNFSLWATTCGILLSGMCFGAPANLISKDGSSLNGELKSFTNDTINIEKKLGNDDVLFQIKTDQLSLINFSNFENFPKNYGKDLIVVKINDATTNHLCATVDAINNEFIVASSPLLGQFRIPKEKVQTILLDFAGKNAIIGKNTKFYTDWLGTNPPRGPASDICYHWDIFSQIVTPGNEGINLKDSRTIEGSKENSSELQFRKRRNTNSNPFTLEKKIELDPNGFALDFTINLSQAKDVQMNMFFGDMTQTNESRDNVVVKFLLDTSVISFDASSQYDNNGAIRHKLTEEDRKKPIRIQLNSVTVSENNNHYISLYINGKLIDTITTTLPVIGDMVTLLCKGSDIPDISDLIVYNQAYSKYTENSRKKELSVVQTTTNEFIPVKDITIDKGLCTLTLDPKNAQHLTKTTTIPLSLIKKIMWEPALSNPEQPTKPITSIRLNNGHILSGSIVDINAKTVNLNHPLLNEIKIPLGDILSISFEPAATNTQKSKP